MAERLQIGPYSQVLAPMTWEGQAVGFLYVIRQPATGFSNKEIALLETFADQAVIAIQNARLFNETKEALEQQTATAEVLQVISSSVADAAPVFDKILDSCRHLFASEQLGDRPARRRRARCTSPRSVGGATMHARTVPSRRSTTIASAVIRHATSLHVPDVGRPAMHDASRSGRIGGNAARRRCPMLWEDRGIGSIMALRQRRPAVQPTSRSRCSRPSPTRP